MHAPGIGGGGRWGGNGLLRLARLFPHGRRKVRVFKRNLRDRTHGPLVKDNNRHHNSPYGNAAITRVSIESPPKYGDIGGLRIIAIPRESLHSTARSFDTCLDAPPRNVKYILASTKFAAFAQRSRNEFKCAAISPLQTESVSQTSRLLSALIINSSISFFLLDGSGIVSM